MIPLHNRLSPAEVDGIGLILLVSAEEIIDQFSLEPHPEGGWFRRTYESKEVLESVSYTHLTLPTTERV